MRFVDLILNGPTPEEKPLPCGDYENDGKIEKLAEWDGLREATELAISKPLHCQHLFLPLFRKVHEAGLSDLESRLVRRYRILLEQKCSEHDDPAEPDYYFNRAPYRYGYDPEIYRARGFDLPSALKQWETLTLSPETLSTSWKSRGHEMIVEDCLTLLFLYAKAGCLDEAERFRSFLREQWLPESASPSKAGRVFEGMFYSRLAWLPDGFSSDGKPYYRNDSDSNLHSAIKSLIECGDPQKVYGQFYAMCWVREKADLETIRSRTFFLADSIAKFPPEIFRSVLYDHLLHSRRKYMNDQELTDLALKAYEALDEPAPGSKESRQWGLIGKVSDRLPELALRFAREYPPLGSAPHRLNLTFGLTEENVIKEYVRLFHVPEYHDRFEAEFIPLFLKKKLNFPVAWIDERIDLAREHRFMQAEAEMLLAKFVHRSLFLDEENADGLLHTALEMIRSIEGDPIHEERNPDKEGYRAEKIRIWMYTGPDVSWKPRGLLHAAKSLAFAGRIDEALKLKEEHFEAVEHACNLAQQGKLFERDIGYTAGEYWKLLHAQANCTFLLGVADAVADSLGLSAPPPVNVRNV